MRRAVVDLALAQSKDGQAVFAARSRYDDRTRMRREIPLRSGRYRLIVSITACLAGSARSDGYCDRASRSSASCTHRIEARPGGRPTAMLHIGFASRSDGGLPKCSLRVRR